jgi:hypothetical protein
VLYRAWLLPLIAESLEMAGPGGLVNIALCVTRVWARFMTRMGVQCVIEMRVYPVTESGFSM